MDNFSLRILTPGCDDRPEGLSPLVGVGTENQLRTKKQRDKEKDDRNRWQLSAEPESDPAI